MTSVSEARDTDRDDWNRFVLSQDDSESCHLYEWRAIFENLVGHRCIYLVARDGSGAVSGVLPLVHMKSRLFGNFLVSVPWFNYGGTLASSETVRGELLAAAWNLAESIGSSHVELRHRGTIETDLPYRDDKVAMRLSLPDSREELWQSFTSKLRAQVRRPAKSGATSHEGGVELLEEFYSVFSRNMRDLGTPVFPRRLFQAMCDTFPETTRIFVVRMNGKACAAGIAHGFRDELEIPSASSLREFNRQSVNMLLYWTVLKYAIRNGYRVFDFGRSTRDAGTYRFKKQWGAVPQSLHWHYQLRPGGKIPALSPQNPRFRLAVNLWRRMPVALANSLGPRIVRHLP